MDSTDVVIFADGSWKVVIDNEDDRSTIQKLNGILEKRVGEKIDGEPTDTPNTREVAIDRTMGDEDRLGDSQTNAVDLTVDEEGMTNSNACEIEDRKPWKSALQQPLVVPANAGAQEVTPGDISLPMSLPTFVSRGSSVITPMQEIHRIGTLESLVHPSILNPVTMDAISPVPPGVSTMNLSFGQQASSFLTSAHAGQLGENLQLPPPWPGNSIINSGMERGASSQVSAVPPAIKTLPSHNQACTPCPSGLSVPQNPIFNTPSNSPSVSYQANRSTAAGLNGLTSRVNAEASTSVEWTHPYLNLGSNICRGSVNVSHQTGPHVMVNLMPQVSSGLGVVSPVERYSIRQVIFLLSWKILYCRRT